MIRKADINDLPQIKRLIDDAATKGKVLERSVQELTEVISSFFVYESENTIRGCCSLEIYNRKLAEIRSLVVHDDFRNQGIGKQLVDACIQEAKDKKIYEVLSITDKVDFFEKRGFRSCLNGQYPLFLRP